MTGQTHRHTIEQRTRKGGILARVVRGLKGSTAGESGNIFMTLFGAVAVVGALGMGSISLLKGPVGTMVKVNQKTAVETGGDLGLKLMMNQVLTSTPDCDSDGTIEAGIWRDPTGGLPAPTGGGWVPDNINMAKTTDPWGQELGYCVWDHGSAVKSGACPDDTRRLEGANVSDEPFIAIVSAGPDQAFQTTCRDWSAADLDDNGGSMTPDGDLDDAGDLPLINKAGDSDDLIFMYTYAGAKAAMGDQWVFQANMDASGDAAKTEQGLDLSGATDTISFGGILDLNKMGGGLVLPDAAGATCDSTTDGQLFRDVSASPPSVVMCEDGTGWVSVGGGASTASGCSLSETDSYTGANLNNAKSVTINGNYAYVASSDADSLTVIDISNPASLSEVGSINNANLDTAYSVAVEGNYAYVASLVADSLTVIDISNPASLSETDSISNANLDGASSVVVSGNYAFVASQVSGSLTVIDISNPASLSEVDSISNGNLNGASGVMVDGNYAYVASLISDSLTVIDISNPASLSEVGSISNGNLNRATGVTVEGNYAYVASDLANSLTVIDISNPASLSEVGSISNANLIGASGVMVEGDYAYVTSNAASTFTVIDISNPASLSESDSYTSASTTGAIGLSILDGYAYVASQNADSLTVMDLGSCTGSGGDSSSAPDVTLNDLHINDTNYIAYAWGSDSNGQLGNGPDVTADQDEPYALQGNLNFQQITADESHACALQTDGTAYCWGKNTRGQLGDNDLGTDKDVPTPVSGNHKFIKIDSGNLHTCALKANGTAWCWGGDDSGQLGNGAGISGNQDEPTQVVNISDFVDVQASIGGGATSYSCGLRANGEIWCWGGDSDGQLGNGSGTTADQEEPVLVQGPTNFVQLGVSERHACGVTEDGSAWCWGYGADGSLGQGEASSSGVPVQVSDIDDFIQVSGSMNNSSTCGLRSNGEVWCWGKNVGGRLGIGNEDGADYLTPQKVINISDAVKLAGGFNHSCALISNGEAWCWGVGANGQKGDGTTASSGTPTQVSNITNFADITSGMFFTVALAKNLQDGDESAPTGPYTIRQSRSAGNTMVSHGLAVNLSSAAAGQKAALAFKVDADSTGDGDSASALIAGMRDDAGGASGNIAFQTWNGTAFSNTVLGNEGRLMFDYPATGVTDIPAAISISRHDNGGAWDSDRFAEGLLISKDTGTINPMFMGIDADTGAATILSAKELLIQHSDALGTTLTEVAKFDETSAELYGDVNSSNDFAVEAFSNTGSDIAGYHFQRYAGSVGSGSAPSDEDPIGTIRFGGSDGTAIPAEGQAQIVGQVATAPAANDVGARIDMYTHNDGSESTSKRLRINETGEILVGNPSSPNGLLRVEGRGAVNEGVKVGNDSTCDDADDEGTLRYTGSVFEYCDGSSWQPLGGGETTCSNNATIYQAMASRENTCVTFSNGQAGCLGSNQSGQIGNISASNPQTTLMTVMDLENVVQIVAGYEFSCALLSNGETWCWGKNTTNYALGNGTYFDADLPTKVNTDSEYVQIAAGYNHACGLVNNGSVECWGNGDVGRLGDGTTGTDSATPVTVSEISNAVKIRAGDSATCALLADRTAKCWGKNEEGQLGNETPSAEESTPVAVNLTDIIDIHVNGAADTENSHFGCAVTTDGSVYCWGDNQYGQVGNGSSGSTNVLTPTQVSGVADAIAITTTGGSACALINDGSIECWGAGYRGLLGNGGTSNQSSPVSVSGISTAVSLADSMSSTHMCAILQDGSMQCWGDDEFGQLGSDDSADTNNHTTPEDFINPLTCDADKYVFITSGQYNGDFGGLEGADALCQSLAEGAGLPGTYMAWLSDDTESPSSRFLNQATGDYKMTNDTVVANGWSQLVSGSLLAAIRRTENDTDKTGEVWTNTTSSGTVDSTTNNCSEWSSTSGNAEVGAATQTDSTWTDAGLPSRPCSDSFRSIYCFQQ